MDVDARAGQGDAPRRIIVDANNPDVEVVGAKRPVVPQETRKKAAVIKFIAETHKLLLKGFGLQDEYMNLSIGDQVHNTLFTCYNVIRQEMNQTGGTLKQRLTGTSFKVTHLGSEYSLERNTAFSILVERAEHNNIPFRKYEPKDPLNWYGIAGPLLNFLSGFALRRKELRLGHHVMPIHRQDGVEKAVNLMQYGIYGCHHVLCEGISFPPEKRASMVQSLGPVTALLGYIKSERKYSGKWFIVLYYEIASSRQCEDAATM